jgi:hypothetical protein
MAIAIEQRYVPACQERFISANNNSIEICRRQWHFIITCSDYESFHNMIVVAKMLALETWDDFRVDAYE